tara:strand:+ start:13001 stop:15355 length:2355 start_codon:yes stop_codon:yes gene_type:complete
MAQTLLSGNISSVYDKLLFTKGAPHKIYASDSAGDTDTEITVGVIAGGTGAVTFPSTKILVGNGTSPLATTNLSATGTQLILDRPAGLTTNVNDARLVFKDNGSSKWTMGVDASSSHNFKMNYGADTLEDTSTLLLNSSGRLYTQVITGLANVTSGAGIIVGDGTNHGAISSEGEYNLRLQTGSGSAKSIIEIGSGDNGDIQISSAGTGSVVLGASTGKIQFATDDILDRQGGKILTVSPTVSAVNNIQFKNAATGTSPSMKATGTDPNINLDIESKGTGDINITSGGNFDFKSSASGIYNFKDAGSNLAAKLSISSGAGALDIYGATGSVNRFKQESRHTYHYDASGTLKTQFDWETASLHRSSLIISGASEPSGAAKATLNLQATSGTDSDIFFTEGAFIKWVMGHDANDSNKFKLSYGGVLGYADKFQLDASGNLTIAGTLTTSAGSPSTVSSLNDLSDVTYSSGDLSITSLDKITMTGSSAIIHHDTGPYIKFTSNHSNPYWYFMEGGDSILSDQRVAIHSSATVSSLDLYSPANVNHWTALTCGPDGDTALTTHAGDLTLDSENGNIILLTNGGGYTPTANNHAATKKYVDDSLPTVPTLNDTDDFSDASSTTTASSESIKAYADDVSGSVSGKIISHKVAGLNAADSTYTLTAGYAPIDTTDAKITFIAPASGNVEVEFHATYNCSGSGRVLYLSMWDTDAALTNTLPAYYEHLHEDSGRYEKVQILHKWYETGLTPGASCTRYFAAKVDNVGGTPTILWGGNASDKYIPMMMKVTQI